MTFKRGAFAFFLALGLPCANAVGPPPPITLRLVTSGLQLPVEIARAGDGSGRLFVAGQRGAIRVVKNGTLLTTPFLDITAQVSSSGERGLLGLAFDPRFPSNRRFYVFYTQLPDDGTGGALRVSSFLASAANPDVADPASEREIITIPHPNFSNHNGGHIAFGPDGYLYIGTGDGGGGGDPNNNGQTLSVLLGKLLRLDVSAGSGYAIPPGNPFVGVGGARPEIWAYGLRNPWRFSFDRATGDLYIADVGQSRREEIDFVPANSPGGRNFGWRVFEGTLCHPDPAAPCSLPNHTLPVLEYGRDQGQAVVGGYVYRGTRSAALRGYYLYADFLSDRVWAAFHEAGTWANFVLIEPPSPVSGATTFGEDDNGELYIARIDGFLFAIDGPPIPVVTTPSPSRMDFNLDARNDLAWKHANGAQGIWLMNGVGSPAASSQSAGAGTSIHRVADFDGDGKSDLLWRGATGSYELQIMNGAAVTSTRHLLDSGTNWEVIATGDLDGDGKADLLWKHIDGSYGTWLMNGAGAPAAATLATPGPGWDANVVADFDGDGKVDILWRHADGSVRTSTSLMLAAGTGWLPTHAADFNADGRMDLVWKHADGSVGLWLMNGASIQDARVLLGAGTGWSVRLAADLDGNGKADLVWVHADGSAGGWLMDGLAASSVSAFAAVGAGWSPIASGDYDGDGRADITWRHADGSHRTWLMNGLAVSASQVTLGPGTGWSVVP